MTMPRLMVFDRFGAYVRDLDPADVFEATHHAVINGEDALSISTTERLAKGQRVVWRDERGLWHEHVVAGGDESHDSGRSEVGTYYCESSWSELRTAPLVIDRRPGLQSPVNARAALESALEGTRWGVGEVDVDTLAGTSWYHVSPWDAVKGVVEVWGGELRADVEAGQTGVTSRKLSLVESLGSGSGVRLDYGRDVSGIKVTYDEGDVVTALYCYGKGVETEAGGYGRKIGIEDVNDGVPYVEDAEAKQVWGQMGPRGLDNAYGIFEDSDCDDPATLKDEGIAALKDAARPKVQYSATVEAFSRAGTDLRGAGLGDRVDIVDRSFYRDRHGADMDLRLTGRVVEVTESLLDPSSTQVVVGDVMGTITDQLADLQGSVNKLTGSAPTWTDAATNATAYVNDLIDRLNQEINATGGYTYVKPGQGIWVYDRAEDNNPTKVINLMGGSMRIADSKTSSGDWDWQSVFVSGHIATQLVTAANLVSGTIRSVDGSMTIDLDNNIVDMPFARVDSSGVTVGDFRQQTLGANAHMDAATGSFQVRNGGSVLGSFSGDGLRVYQGGKLVARFLSDGTRLYQGGKQVAHFSSSSVGLGENSSDSQVSLSGGMASMLYRRESGYYIIDANNLQVGENNDSVQIGDTGSIILSSASVQIGRSSPVTSVRAYCGGNFRQLKAIHRLTNPYQANTFVYIAEGTPELSSLVSAGWVDQGTYFYAFA